MIQEVKKYQINIFGQSYTILSDEPENEILQAATSVDSMIKEIGKVDTIDATKAAVFVAFKLARKLQQIESENINLKDTQNRLLQSIDNQLKDI